MINATIIADSLNEFGQRLTTFVLVFPRIVLAEFNTHRVLSRNSASSRAIPFERMLKMVKENPFIPIKWMKDHKGMQGTEYFEIGLETVQLEEGWKAIRDAAVEQASIFSKAGVTKQICNRLLEPFMWHTVIVTASEWENFFALRAEQGAEIHIQELANQMLEAYNFGTPKQLKAGEWHVPFGDKITNTQMNEQFGRTIKRIEGLDLAVKIATARCARVSYLNFEGKDDYEADIKLHDMLLKSGHMSPMEHCARAMSKDEYFEYVNGRQQHHHDNMVSVHENTDWYTIPEESKGWCGNFRGFIQYRKMIKDENKRDSRVIAK